MKSLVARSLIGDTCRYRVVGRKTLPAFVDRHLPTGDRGEIWGARSASQTCPLAFQAYDPILLLVVNAVVIAYMWIVHGGPARIPD